MAGICNLHVAMDDVEADNSAHGSIVSDTQDPHAHTYSHAHRAHAHTHFLPAVILWLGNLQMQREKQATGVCSSGRTVAIQRHLKPKPFPHAGCHDFSQSSDRIKVY